MMATTQQLRTARSDNIAIPMDRLALFGMSYNALILDHQTKEAYPDALVSDAS